MSAFACVASAEFGSAAMTFSIALTVPSLSPLLSATSPSLKSGFPHAGSASDAFWYHFAASSVSPFANFPSPGLDRTSQLAFGACAAAPGAAAFFQRERDRRIGGANRLHRHFARLGRISLHRRRERPRARSQADD